MEYFLCVLGLVMIVEGLPYFAFPDKMKEMMAKIRELPDDTLRKIGFMLMFGGLVLAYFSKTI